MNQRYEKGRLKFREIGGPDAEAALASLSEVSPDFVKYLMEFPFGDIYSRPQLDAKTREIVAIAALASMDSNRQLLKAHVEAALRLGASQAEVVEVLIQISVLAGFPAAISALLTAGQVFHSTGSSVEG